MISRNYFLINIYSFSISRMMGTFLLYLLFKFRKKKIKLQIILTISRKYCAQRIFIERNTMNKIKYELAITKHRSFKFTRILQQRVCLRSKIPFFVINEHLSWNKTPLIRQKNPPSIRMGFPRSFGKEEINNDL